MTARTAPFPARPIARTEPLPPPPDHLGRAMVEVLIAELIARAAVGGIVASERLQRAFEGRGVDRARGGRC